MQRSRDYVRKMRKKHIKRRKNICQKAYGWDWYEYDGQYSKGKIYCGCSICKRGKYKNEPTIKTMRYNTKMKSDMDACKNNEYDGPNLLEAV